MKADTWIIAGPAFDAMPVWAQNHVLAQEIYRLYCKNLSFRACVDMAQGSIAWRAVCVHDIQRMFGQGEETSTTA